MAAPPRAAFRSGLADLAVGERARFVAALYRARGWTAEVDAGDSGSDTDAPVVTISRDGERRRLLVHEPGWLPAPLSLPASVPEGVDAVVTPRNGRPGGVPPGTTVIDGDALYERAVHGIDAAARDRLFGEYFDDPAVATPGPGDSSGAQAAPAGSRPRWRTLHAVLGVVALGLVVAAVFGLPTAPGEPGSRSAAEGIGPSTPFVGAGVANGTATAGETSAAESTSTPVAPDAYPPGIDESGIVDAERLLTAHARSLGARHYRLVSTYEEYRNGRLTGWRQLVATVRRPSLVRTSLSARGSEPGIADPTPTTELFADGDTVYYRDRVDNRTRYRVDEQTLPLARAAAFGTPYLSRTLDANSSRLIGTVVVDGTRLFNLRVSGDADPRTDDVTGTLLVDTTGVVHWFRRSYTPNGTDAIGIQVTMRYDFEDVVVERPAWLDEARAALGNRSVAYVPPLSADTDIPANATDGGNRTLGTGAAAPRRPAGRRRGSPPTGSTPGAGIAVP